MLENSRRSRRGSMRRSIGFIRGLNSYRALIEDQEDTGIDNDHMVINAKVSLRPNEEIKIPVDITLTLFKIFISRKFGIPFEDQHILHYDTKLEGDSQLVFYSVCEHDTLHIVRKKIYRTIGNHMKKIKTVEVKENPFRYRVYEIVPPLPTIKTVLQRVATAVMYLLRLDRMQRKKNNKRVFKFQVLNNAASRRRSTTSHRKSSALLTEDFASMLNSDNGNGTISKSTILNILQTPIVSRSSMDIRVLKKWIQKLQYFQDSFLSESALIDVCRNVQHQTFHPGDYIFEQGDKGKYFYILITGKVSLSAMDCGLFATLEAGKCFGEGALFQDEETRSATAMVDYFTPTADLAMIDKNVYQRSIMHYKLARLHGIQKALSSHMPYFNTMIRNSFVRLTFGIEKKTFKAKETIFLRGDNLDRLYFVTKGEIQLIFEDEKAEMGTVNQSQESMEERCDAKRKVPTSSGRCKSSEMTREELFNQMVDEMLCRNQEKRTTTHNTSSARNFRNPKAAVVMNLFKAPIVLGQECIKSGQAKCTALTMSSCTVFCLHQNQIHNFLMPYPSILNEIMSPHHERLRTFKRRLKLIIDSQQSSDSRAVNMGPATTLNDLYFRHEGDGFITWDEAMFDCIFRVDGDAEPGRQKDKRRDSLLPSLELLSGGVLKDWGQGEAKGIRSGGNSSRRVANETLAGGGGTNGGTSTSNHTRKIARKPWKCPPEPSPRKKYPTLSEERSRALKQVLPLSSILAGDELRYGVQSVAVDQAQLSLLSPREQRIRRKGILDGLRKLGAERVMEVDVSSVRNQVHFELEITPS